MAYAVELYFDKIAEATLYQMWQAIEAVGLKYSMLDAGYRPHISLAVYDSDAIDVDAWQQALSVFAQSITPFEIVLSNIGIFPTNEGVLYLGCTVTTKILEVHAQFHYMFERYTENLRVYYDIEVWVPHVTLAFGLSVEQCAQILPTVWPLLLPVKAQVREVGLVNVSPTKSETLLCCNIDNGK